jgi:hypothetical protein
MTAATIATSAVPAVSTLREAQAQLTRFLVAADAELDRLGHRRHPWRREPYNASARTACRTCGARASVSLNVHRLEVAGAALRVRCVRGCLA